MLNQLQRLNKTHDAKRNVNAGLATHCAPSKRQWTSIGKGRSRQGPPAQVFICLHPVLGRAKASRYCFCVRYMIQDEINGSRKLFFPCLCAGGVAFLGLQPLAEWRVKLLKHSPPHGLGYPHLASMEEDKNIKAFPVSYPLF